MSDETKDTPKAPMSEEERQAKIKAAAEARAARAAAAGGTATGATTGSAATAGGAEEAPPKEPSPNQPLLDHTVQLIQSNIGDDAIEQSFINERDRHLPVIVIKAEHWWATAILLRDDPSTAYNYLRNLSGVDQETHLEVVYHLLSLSKKHEVCIKVKTAREGSSVPSVTSVWSTANWNEREVFDLLGIDFPGHPDMRRIMMPDDWVGYPLRKDYEPLDPEV
jgi:NADH-quinone oxidoreductase subunit C